MTLMEAPCLRPSLRQVNPKLRQVVAQNAPSVGHFERVTAIFIKASAEMTKKNLPRKMSRLPSTHKL